MLVIGNAGRGRTGKKFKYLLFLNEYNFGSAFCEFLFMLKKGGFNFKTLSMYIISSKLFLGIAKKKSTYSNDVESDSM